MHSQYLHPFYFIFQTEPPTITKTTMIFPIPSLTVPFSHAFLHPWPSPLTPFLNTLTHFFPYDHRSKDITTTPSIMSSMELDVEWFIWWKFIGIHTNPSWLKPDCREERHRQSIGGVGARRRGGTRPCFSEDRGGEWEEEEFHEGFDNLSLKIRPTTFHFSDPMST